ncbi:MAG: DUF5719 family protein [Acidimicrobiales bacterium]
MTESMTSQARHLRRPGGSVPGRLAAVVVVLAAIAGPAVADAVVTAPAAPTAVGPLDGVPIAPTGAYSSSAFCTGGAAGADGLAGTTIYLTNTTPAAVDGSMTTWVAPGTAGGSASQGTPGAPSHREIVVPAGGSAAVNPGAGLPAGDLATSFAFDGGGVAVNQVASGANGWSTAPCASQTSGSWYFAGGSTAAGNVLTLDLFNPSATDAVVNLSFVTPGGVVAPSTYQGLEIPAGQVVSENIGDFVQGQGEIGTVLSAQSGSVVADELQQWSSGSTGGVSLRLGSPALSSSWHFAQTTDTTQGTVTFHLANPGASAVTATFDIGLPMARVAPFQVSVPAQSVTTFVASGSGRLPVQTPYSVNVQATGDIVVSRSVQAAPGSATPVWGAEPGTTTTATHWLVPPPGVQNAPGTAGATVDSLGVANPGSTPSRVVVTAAGTGAAVVTLVVPPGSMTVLGPKVVGGLRPFDIDSSRPVVVEEDSGPTGAPGVVSSAGMPFWP